MKTYLNKLSSLQNKTFSIFLGILVRILVISLLICPNKLLSLENLYFIPQHTIAVFGINLNVILNNTNLSSMINEEIKKLDNQQNQLYLEIKEVLSKFFTNLSEINQIILALVPTKSKSQNIESKNYHFIYFLVGNFNLEQLQNNLLQENKNSNKIKFEKNNNFQIINFLDYKYQLLMLSNNLLCICKQDLSTYIITSYIKTLNSTLASISKSISEIDMIYKQASSNKAIFYFTVLFNPYVKKDIYQTLKEIKLAELVQTNNINGFISYDSEKLSFNLFIQTPSSVVARKIAGPIQNFINEVKIQSLDHLNNFIKTILSGISYNFENSTLQLVSSISGNSVKNYVSDIFNFIFTLSQEDMIEYQSNVQFKYDESPKYQITDDDPMLPAEN